MRAKECEGVQGDDRTQTSNRKSLYCRVVWDFVTYRGAFSIDPVYLMQDFIAGAIDPDRIRMSFDPSDPRSPSDFPCYIRGLLVTNKRGMDTLGSFFSKACQVYSIASANEFRFLIHCHNYLPGFDIERSSFSKFRDGGLMRVSKFVVLPDFSTSLDIFRLQGDPAISFEVFVSERFRGAYDAAGLTGLIFREVYI